MQASLAIIASVENPTAMFEAAAPPQVSNTLQTLDLGGHGIRAMAYVAALDGYLVISGPASRAPEAFGLWFWSGQPDAPARRVTVAGLPGFERAEGLCPAVIDGAPKMIIVSDDGSRNEGRFARFVLLEPGQMQIAPRRHRQSLDGLKAQFAVRAQAHESKRVHIRFSMNQHQVRLDVAIAAGFPFTCQGVPLFF